MNRSLYILCIYKKSVLLSLFSIIISLFLTNCTSEKNGLLISYTIDVTTIVDSIKVTMEIKNINYDEITLKPYAQDEFLSISKFKIYTDNGRELKYISNHYKKQILKQNFSYTNWTIPLRKIKNIIVKYYVKPGNFEKNIKNGYTGEKYGCISNEFLLISGKNIFLLPTTDFKVDDIKVKFNIDGPLKITSTLKENNGIYFPNCNNNLIIENFVNSIIGIGKFEKREKIINGTIVEIFLFQGWNEESKKKFSNIAFSLFEYISNLFYTNPLKNYTTVLIPKDNNFNIFIPAWTSGQGTSISLNSIERWQNYAENIFYIWNKFKPYRMELKNKKDYWFVDGIALYYSLKSLVYANLIDEEELYELLYEQYTDLLYPRDFVLAEYYDNPSNFFDEKRFINNRKAKLVLVVKSLDDQIKKFTKNKKSLIDIINYHYDNKRVIDLKKSIENYFNIELSDFFNKYIMSIDGVIPDFRKFGYIRTTSEPLNSSKTINNLYKCQIDTITILHTGNTHCYLENCGCKVNQSGGVARRASYINMVRRERKNVLLVDCGGVFPSLQGIRSIYYDDLTSHEIDIYLKTMEMMDYNLSGIGISDLSFGLDYFYKKINKLKFPFLATNLQIDDSFNCLPSFSININKYRVCFLCLFRNPDFNKSNYLYESNTENLFCEKPINVLKNIIPKIKKEDDIVIIIGNLKPYTIRKIVMKFDGIDLIISTNRIYFQHEYNSRYDYDGFIKNTLVVYSHTSSYGIGKLDLIIHDDKIINYNSDYTLLSEEFVDNPNVREFINNFYNTIISNPTIKLETIRLDIYKKNKQKFVGANECKQCHEEQYSLWRKTKHSSSFKSLLAVHRNFVPKCVVCHVTGFGYNNGFKITESESKMSNVQCEMCHNQGELHINNPEKESLIRKPSKEYCIECHTREHSDMTEANFGNYYKKIIH